ncbi:MAG: sn-glycerol-1-phosphate dehydrogenase, partial [Bacillota bacterium]|nr:sn-glycerol-1-phosphate dehydrogenase [Bacillota bacterium]
MDLLNMEVSSMSGISFDCSCGQKHNVAIGNIRIGSGVINELPELLRGLEGKKIFIVADRNTYRVAGTIVEEKLKDGFVLSRFVFEEEHFIPDEKALGRLLVEIERDTSMIVAVGSGSINDTCRYLSYKLGIPYIIVGTAPSMDGYASVVSPLIVDNVKVTYNAVYPEAIVADTDILKEAPMYMLHAGFGDILGKYTALADWHLARTLNKEYFCSAIEELVLKAVDKCVKAADRIAERDDETIKSITEALIFTGLAIGMTGTSRPASGEEHHLSHCWEMISMNEGRYTKWLHGNNVGVGVGIIAEAYSFVNNLDIEAVYATGKYRNLDRNQWARGLSEVYTRSAASIIKFKEGSIAFESEQSEINMKNIMKNWSAIKEICSELLPNPEVIRGIMKQAGTI